MKYNMNQEKRVSVVMCTYNGEKYLREQIDSILSQTYPIYELIIQDDCSTDRTVEIVRKYQKNNSNIKLFQNKTNLGFNENFKDVIYKASGDFVAISDQDDIWELDKIKKQVEFIGDKFICCSYYEEGSDIYQCNKKELKPFTNIERLMFTNFIPGHTMLLSRQFIDNIDCWGIGIYYDWALAINASITNNIVCCNSILNWHRKHNSSAIDTLRNRYLKESKLRNKSYLPYFFGYSYLKSLREKEKFIRLYTYINNKSEQGSLINRISNLLTKQGILPLIRLFFCCLKNRQIIYPKKINNKYSLAFCFRSFFYPFIFAYKNINFE